VRAVVQRVAHASVAVDGEEVGRCGMGLLVLLAVAPNDTDSEVKWLAKKVAGLRIFPDENHHMNRGMTDVQGEALVISQFTLYGDCRKGRRPSFIRSAPPDKAEPLYLQFCDALAAEGVPTSQGVFGADMKVSLLNDGPVTLVVDTPPVRS
jgi:D-tyrosyl-tRNA(Tyr) deacylase